MCSLRTSLCLNVERRSLPQRSEALNCNISNWIRIQRGPSVSSEELLHNPNMRGQTGGETEGSRWKWERTREGKRGKKEMAKQKRGQFEHQIGTWDYEFSSCKFRPCIWDFLVPHLSRQTETPNPEKKITGCHSEIKQRKTVSQMTVRGKERWKRRDSRIRPCWSEENRKRTVWSRQARRHWCRPRRTYWCDDNDRSGLAWGMGVLGEGD